MYLEREMRKDTKVARTASKNGIEHLGISGFCDFFGVPLVVHYLDRENVISEQAKTASQLAISTGLDVAPDVDIGTLSVGHEQLVLREISVECPQTPADARANIGFPVLLENGLIVGTKESLFQVQLDVGSGSRRRTTVLMASSPDRYGNFLGFGVLEHIYNIVLVFGLDYKRWVHVVVYFVAG